MFCSLQHIATYWNTLQHTAKHCNMLQHAATCCNTLGHQIGAWYVRVSLTLQHPATHCYMQQHVAACCNMLQHTGTWNWFVACSSVSLIATHCNTLQYIATHCITLRHTATHCNTLGHLCLLLLQTSSREHLALKRGQAGVECVAVCVSVLQCSCGQLRALGLEAGSRGCCNVLQRAAVISSCYSVLRFVAVSCSGIEVSSTLHHYSFPDAPYHGHSGG